MSPHNTPASAIDVMEFLDTPKSVDIAVTSRCNLRCRYCSHFGSPGEVDRDLPADRWIEFFGELKHQLVFNVVLQGAEPFHRKDFDRILSGVAGNKMRYAVLSNGTLIDKEWARFLEETKRCDFVQVSIDSSIPSHHDAARGEGSFHKACRGIAMLRKHNIKVECRATISKHNVHDLEGLAEFLLEEMGLSRFGVNAASYLGLCMKNEAEVGLSVEERSLAMESLLLLNRKYRGRITATAGPLAEAVTWRRMIEAREKNLDRFPNGGYLTSCGANRSRIAVRADGTYVPCIQMSHLELGTIGRDSLRDIWHHSPKLNAFRNRRKTPLSDFAYCRECEFMDYCTGNCPATARTLCGSDFVPSPDACLKKFLEDGGKLPDPKLYESSVF